MPKLRSSLDSFMDAQRHITIGRSRVDKNNYSPVNSKKLDSIMTLLTEVIASTEKEVKSLLNKDLNNAAVLIEKELKKDINKIDYLPIVRDIYSATSRQKALQIGIQRGIERDQVVQLMARAPINTNLGKIMAEYKQQLEQAKATPIEPPAAIIPTHLQAKASTPVFEQDDEENEDITNNSDNEPPDDLRKLLASDI